MGALCIAVLLEDGAIDVGVRRVLAHEALPLPFTYTKAICGERLSVPMPVTGSKSIVPPKPASAAPISMPMRMPSPVAVGTV